MKRRTFIKHGLTAVALAGTGGLFLPGKSGLVPAAQVKGFTTSLHVPPLLENLDGSGNSASFNMNVHRGKIEFFPGKMTATLGYNGNFLGPTIRVRNGQRFRINVNNTLSDVTTLHWHGLHVPAQWDGGPRQPISAGTTWNPDFVINQEAATLWYHPHAMGLTGEQVYHGLAGLFLIEDEVSDTLDIPKTYGVDDIPIIIQDRRFFSNGQFAYVQNMHDVMNGVIGNYLLVNGVMQPTLTIPEGQVRLRLLNGSNSSIYKIAFDDQRTFHVIASDGGFLERPVPMNAIVLSAGERAEILVDFSKESKYAVISLLVDQMRGSRFEAMRIIVNGTAQVKAMPQTLRAKEKIFESEASRTRRFIMETMSMGGGRMGMGMMGRRLAINGKKMDINRIDERIKLGSTEIWEITNRSAMMMRMPHSIHLHDVQFQILSRNGRIPPLHEQGRKDTVLIQPGETVRIISRFQDYTGVYMYHCHLLEHEDDGMMGQFEVFA
ncbi:MAG: multicopper oxidase domain-containing protein [Proteobacteria bacterium]|nr:multicopper oxidase domain-containing protein [Pseudomonadota bacterium]MBU1543742.1 multicopper oxidase domain-containing protein [Pseudomonadota bacterium]MBU2481443.1 multicopper oxidase domain-containing protein [Pseudomonadota bacterium]